MRWKRGYEWGLTLRVECGLQAAGTPRLVAVLWGTFLSLGDKTLSFLPKRSRKNKALGRLGSTLLIFRSMACGLGRSCFLFSVVVVAFKKYILFLLIN